VCVSRRTWTQIDGLLYLDEMLKAADDPGAELRALADVMAHLAQQLDARCLHVSCEDDASLRIKAGGFRLPSLFGVYPAGVIDVRCLSTWSP